MIPVAGIISLIMGLLCDNEYTDHHLVGLALVTLISQTPGREQQTLMNVLSKEWFGMCKINVIIYVIQHIIQHVIQAASLCFEIFHMIFRTWVT